MSSTAVNPMAFCHQCGTRIRPLMTPDPTCPRCNGQFVEIIFDEDNYSGPQGFDPMDDDSNLFGMAGFGDVRFHPQAASDRPSNQTSPGVRSRARVFHPGAPESMFFPEDIDNFVHSLFDGRDGTARRQNSGDTHPGASSTSDQDPNQPNSTATGNPDSSANTHQRSGHRQFGPFGVQWNVQMEHGDTGRNSAMNEQANQATGQIPTLSNFLRAAFGDRYPQQRTDQDPSNQHDDGMGGAGAASDGRAFNHDNREGPASDRTPRAEQEDHQTRDNNNLPPELAGLRDLLSSLFGTTDDGGVVFSVLNPTGGGFRGGQWGDYVLGQQGWDDIVSQLMEQTQSSNAPPPANDDEISKLERFKLGDTARISKSKNTDCPTCKEEFVSEPAATRTETRTDTETAAGAEAREDDAKPTSPNDEDESQQQELIAMPCGHTFHEDCLVPWLRLHGTCPVCRVSIVKPRSESSQDPSSGSSGSSSTTRDGVDSSSFNSSNSQQPAASNQEGSGGSSGGARGNQTETRASGSARILAGFPSFFFGGLHPPATAAQPQPAESAETLDLARPEEEQNENGEQMREAAEKRERDAATSVGSIRPTLTTNIQGSSSTLWNTATTGGSHSTGSGSNAPWLEPDELD